LNVATETALLACAQMNVIEFHTWNSTLDDGEHPDRIVFDLDPGEGIVWKQIQQSATLMKTLLDQLHLTSFLKTSGGKGLHVIVPIVPELGWDTVKDFAAAVVRHMANTLPTLFVAKSGPRNRINRIFIDYLRNGLGATTVSAFSVRARAGLGVSVPVAWEELPDLRGADHWTVANATERLDKQYKRVWATYEKSAQRLHDAMQAIGFEH
jgi:bifunctional non-homologous end joining protein LigD